MDPFSLATGIVGLITVALKLVTGALGMIDKTIADHDEAAGELKKLQEDLEELQTQMSRIYTTLKVLASNTKNRTFKKMLRDEDGNTALDELCTALDATFDLLKRLTDRTTAQESRLQSLSLPDDTRSLAFVKAVLKHNLGPSKTAVLGKTLGDMRSEIQTCLRKLDNAFQHSWRLYTAISDGLARVPTNGSTVSTSTMLTARIKLIDRLKDYKDTWEMSKQRNGAITVEQLANDDHVASNTLVTPFQERYPPIMYTYRAQAVEAIRISHELARSGTDHAELCTSLAAFDAAIEAAVKAETGTRMDIFRDFVGCLNDKSYSKRMKEAKRQDQRNLGMRLEGVLEKVIKSPLRRSRQLIFDINDLRFPLAVEIPHDAELPDILWEFHRTLHTLRKDTHIINPHFYSRVLFGQGVIKEILPLVDLKGKGDEEWTTVVRVYGDSKDGPIKLTSQDETIQRVFGAVTEHLKLFTLFKDIEGRLLAERDVDLIFSSARDLKCFRWRDSSFVLDPDVRSVQDVVNSSKKKQTELLVPSPLSMGPTDLSQGAHHSISPVIVFPNGRFLSWDSPSGSASIVPHRPRPSRPPPTTQDSLMNHEPWSFARLEDEMAQVAPPKEMERSIPADGGANLGGFPGSSSAPVIAVVDPRHDPAPAPHLTWRPSLTIVIPYANRTHLPLPVPAPPLSEDESIISPSSPPPPPH